MKKIDFSELKKLFSNYKEKYFSSFDDTQKNLSEEMLNKINDLESISNEISDLIFQLFPLKNLLPDENDTLHFMGISIKLHRADPNIPIGIDNATKAYSRGQKVNTSEEVAKLENKLERITIEFYQIAHRVTHITKRLPGLESFKSDSIRIVRNQLIEHPEGKDSGVTHDSFAYSLNEGPYVKGLRQNTQKAHMDKGFYSNGTEFLCNLISVLKKLL